MGLAANLKRHRTDAGLSQKRLADKAGVSQQLISQIENDVPASTKALPQLAHALGISVFDLDPDFGAIGEPDAAREELMSLYDRLGVLPGWQDYLLEQARQLEARVLGQEAPLPPKAEAEKQ
jgi:transcriptional regulator with XRE-family HTH domain